MRYILVTLLLTFSIQLMYGQKSLKLDGTNDYIQTNYSGIMGKTDRTFEAWVFVPSNAPTRNLVVMDFGRNAVGSRNTFLVSSSKGLSYISGGTNANIGSGSNTVPTNKWVHLAFVLNNGTGYLYVDGIQVGTGNLSTVNTPSGFTNYRIGNRVPGGSNLYFPGEIDEIRIWDAALSAAQIQDWMCQEVNSSHPRYSNLQGYWKMDTVAGTVAKDYSGKGRNGTLQNGPTWQNYGAPVGTKSSAHYANSGLRVSLKHADGDSLKADNVTASAKGIHVYYRSGSPNHITVPGGLAGFDTSRHWGVYVAGATSHTYNLSYHYTPNNHFKTYGGCSNDLLSRASNATTSWTSTTPSVTGGSLSLTGQTSKEFMLGYFTSGKPTITSTNGNDTVLGCNGDTVQLSFANSGFSYQWLKNGQPLLNDTLQDLNVTTGGNYSMILSNSSTCNDTSNTLHVIFNNRPTVSFAPLSDVCDEEAPFLLTGGTPVGGNYSSAYNSGNLFVPQSSGPGLFKVTYEYTDSKGCSDTSSQMQRVHPLPQVTLASQALTCEDSAAFPLTGGMPLGGAYLINGLVTTTFDASSLGVGKHWILYEYTDINSCTALDSTQAEVAALPTVSLNLIKKSFCEYDQAAVMDGQNPRGGVFSGSGVSGNNFSPSTAGAGSHEITYRITDPVTGCKNVANDTIEVSARPARPVITQVGDSLKIPLEFTHRWFRQNGSQVSGVTTNAYKPLVEGEYYAQVQNQAGCWSLNSDTILYRISGVAQNTLENQIHFYPNPADHSIRFHISNGQDYHMQLIGADGRVLLNQTVKDQDEVDLSSVQSGVYVLRLSDGSGGSLVERVVVRR